MPPGTAFVRGAVCVAGSRDDNGRGTLCKVLKGVLVDVAYDLGLNASVNNVDVSASSSPSPSGGNAGDGTKLKFSLAFPREELAAGDLAAELPQELVDLLSDQEQLAATLQRKGLELGATEAMGTSTSTHGAAVGAVEVTDEAGKTHRLHDVVGGAAALPTLANSAGLFKNIKGSVALKSSSSSSNRPTPMSRIARLRAKARMATAVTTATAAAAAAAATTMPPPATAREFDASASLHKAFKLQIRQLLQDNDSSGALNESNCRVKITNVTDDKDGGDGGNVVRVYFRVRLRAEAVKLAPEVAAVLQEHLGGDKHVAFVVTFLKAAESLDERIRRRVTRRSSSSRSPTAAATAKAAADEDDTRAGWFVGRGGGGGGSDGAAANDDDDGDNDRVDL